jgi:hypothetical protein
MINHGFWFLRIPFAIQLGITSDHPDIKSRDFLFAKNKQKTPEDGSS